MINRCHCCHHSHQEGLQLCISIFQLFFFCHSLKWLQSSNFPILSSLLLHLASLCFNLLYPNLRLQPIFQTAPSVLLIVEGSSRHSRIRNPYAKILGNRNPAFYIEELFYHTILSNIKAWPFCHHCILGVIQNQYLLPPLSSMTIYQLTNNYQCSKSQLFIFPLINLQTQKTSLIFGKQNKDPYQSVFKFSACFPIFFLRIQQCGYQRSVQQFSSLSSTRNPHLQQNFLPPQFMTCICKQIASTQGCFSIKSLQIFCIICLPMLYLRYGYRTPKVSMQACGLLLKSQSLTVYAPITISLQNANLESSVYYITTLMQNDVLYLTGKVQKLSFLRRLIFFSLTSPKETLSYFLFCDISILKC